MRTQYLRQHHSSSRWKISTHLNSWFFKLTLLSSYPYSNSSHLTTITNPSLCLTPNVTFDSGFSLSPCLVLAQAFTVSPLSYFYNCFHVSIPLPPSSHAIHLLYCCQNCPSSASVILDLSTLDISAWIVLCCRGTGPCLGRCLAASLTCTH